MGIIQRDNLGSAERVQGEWQSKTQRTVVGDSLGLTKRVRGEWQLKNSEDRGYTRRSWFSAKRGSGAHNLMKRKRTLVVIERA